MSKIEDPYRALGVEPTATTEDIQNAFRRIIRSLHPDHHGDAPADHLAITSLVEAWHLLGDPARRADFDRTRRSADDSLWHTAQTDADHETVYRTALLVRLFLVTTIATTALLIVLFIIAMTQSG